MVAELNGSETVLTGVLEDQSAVFGVLAQIEVDPGPALVVGPRRAGNHQLPARTARLDHGNRGWPRRLRRRLPMSKEQQSRLDAILRQGGFDTAADVTSVRAAFNALMAQVPVPADVLQKPIEIGGVGGIEVTIPGNESEPVILYFHAGVYVIGSAATSVPLVGGLVRRTGVNAITLDYRLAPEYPYPAAVEDARAAYEGLLAQGMDPGQIVLAGESAGGGLAVALLLAAREAGLPMPSCAFLMSPYADLTLSGETLTERQSLDPILTQEGLRVRAPEYVAGADASDPLISPIFGDLSGLPPLLIQVGSHEILLSDALRLAARAATTDVAVTLDVTPGVPHVFQGYAGLLDEAGAALDRASDFVKAQLGYSPARVHSV
jgi:monoterpene epsilon-lactone hydrolase